MHLGQNHLARQVIQGTRKTWTGTEYQNEDNQNGHNMDCHDRHRIAGDSYRERLPPQIPGATDLNVRFRLGWDDANLYVLAQVADPSPLQNTHEKGDLVKGDCVELFIGPGAMDQGEGLQPGDRIVLLGVGVPEGKTKAWIRRALVQTECQVVVRPAVGGYVLEAAIPFAALGFKAVSGRQIRFDLALDDSMDGKKQRCQLMWNGTWRNQEERSAWGTATFE